MDDAYWCAVRAFLEDRMGDGDDLLAPNEFLAHFSRTYAYRVAYALDPARFAWVALHKGMLEEIPREHLDYFLRERVPVFANEVFVVLGRSAEPSDDVAAVHVAALHARLPAALPPRPSRTAIVVTTHDRPGALARSLPQIAALGAEVLVVDDASPRAAAEQVAELCRAHGARRLRIPENRGLPAAVNVGIAYWLADEDVHWISCFNDDVDVRSDALAVLARVQEPRRRPILTGRATPLHPSDGRERIAGVETVWLRSAPGIHLHAHRDYWRAVLPIPTPYLGAPKRDRGLPGQGSDEDFWITCWSPDSIVKRGGRVTCVPGLVRTFSEGPEASTWGAPPRQAPDPPLAGAASPDSGA